MKSPPSSYVQQEMAEEAGVSVSVGMDVDDADLFDVLGADFEKPPPPVDADFFNSFEDDFDDSDIA